MFISKEELISKEDIKVRYIRHNGHPVATVAVAQDKMGRVYGTMAICHASDQFKKKVAHSIVTGRLLKGVNELKYTLYFVGTDLKDLAEKLSKRAYHSQGKNPHLPKDFAKLVAKEVKGIVK